ncbi:MAG: hypothetical protein EOL93_03170 [Epsilonproteobacteria bacterium]|nr:hypothetical protein [Campylobacterota bacterium]
MTGQTAAEIIVSRANATRSHMALFSKKLSLFFNTLTHLNACYTVAENFKGRVCV